MNEELKAKLLTYLAHLEGAVKGTGDFVAEQAPLVVQEYILYMRVSTTWPLLLFVVSLLIVVINAWWLCSYNGSMVRLEDHPRTWVALTHAAATLLVGIIVVCHNADPCVKAWTAPRILVLDYIKEQVQ